MSSQLQTKLTWGRASLEKSKAARPYGCPYGHSFQDSIDRAKATQKSYEMTLQHAQNSKQSSSQEAENLMEKIRNVVIRPKRQAAVNSQVKTLEIQKDESDIFDNFDDSDDDGHYQDADELSSDEEAEDSEQPQETKKQFLGPSKLYITSNKIFKCFAQDLKVSATQHQLL